MNRRGYAYSCAARRDEALRLLREGVPADAAILDMAAAQRNFSLALAELRYRVTWNHLCAELVDYVKMKHDHGSITYAPGNAFELKLPQPFDAVLATEAVEHVADPEEFLCPLRGLVRRGGYIVVTTPNGGHFRNRLPTLSEIKDRSPIEARTFQPDADGHRFLLHAGELQVIAQALAGSWRSW